MLPLYFRTGGLKSSSRLERVFAILVHKNPHISHTSPIGSGETPSLIPSSAAAALRSWDDLNRTLTSRASQLLPHSTTLYSVVTGDSTIYQVHFPTSLSSHREIRPFDSKIERLL